jgi:hypothetical protein
MGARRVCQVLAVLVGMLGVVLLVEAQLGRAVLPWEEPDPTTGTAGLCVLFLGLLVLAAGEVAALRQRLEQLERRLQAAECPPGVEAVAEPVAAADLRSKPPGPLS